jgi:hypothetical protein
MWIVPKEEEQVDSIARAVRNAVDKSRFTAVVEMDYLPGWNRHRRAVKITKIRLRNRKSYCGQHAGPCIVNPFFGVKKHPISVKLEGSDWIGWNDGINDILDKIAVDAKVWTANREAAKPGRKGVLVGVSRYYIRKGRCRRIFYDAQFHTNSVGVTFAHWVEGRDCDYQDYCEQKAPRAMYEDGTPGLACWTLKEEKELVGSFEHAH